MVKLSPSEAADVALVADFPGDEDISCCPEDFPCDDDIILSVAEDKNAEVDWLVFACFKYMISSILRHACWWI